MHYQLVHAINKTAKVVKSELPIEIADYVNATTLPLQESNGNPPYPSSPEPALLLCDVLIEAIDQALAVNDSTPQQITRLEPAQSKAFIVHGHDQANSLRLQRLLLNRYAIEAIILQDVASSGNTIIEKFESEAASCSYAFVLLTKDDQILDGDVLVSQARPNVIFELGWFYGRLGRKSVCILSERGVKIHSDLSGVVRLEFDKSIEEVALSLERELEKAGLI